jgi:hypothetical protein
LAWVQYNRSGEEKHRKAAPDASVRQHALGSPWWPTRLCATLAMSQWVYAPRRAVGEAAIAVSNISAALNACESGNIPGVAKARSLHLAD